VAEPAELVRAELEPVLAVPEPLEALPRVLLDPLKELEPLKLLLVVLAVPAPVVLSVAVVAVPDEPKLTLPVISNWLCGGGGTVPDAMLDEAELVTAELVTAELVAVLVAEPLAVVVLLRLAEARAGEQLAVPEVAAWYCSAPASMPVGNPAPAQPVSSMPTPSGRPASGRRRRLARIFVLM
jgi:hypothetical protein